MTSNATYAQLAGAAYDPANTPLPSGWVLLQTSPQNSSGYDGAAFRNNMTGEIVVAHRGTEPLTFDGDWTSNLQMGVNQLPNQYQDAQQFLANVQAANRGASISITGHSLGGALAQLTAADTGLPATTFNAYGAKDLLPLIPPNDRVASGDFSNITNHQTLLDPVSRLPGSSQIGDMHTHVAPSEIPVWAVAVAIGKLPGAAGASIWSHGMGRFEEIYSNPAKAIIDAGQSFGDTINGIEQTIADIFSAAQRFIPKKDPLTLDLNGNGLETVPVSATNPVYFDLTGEGVQSSVGWVAPNDGFLTLDRNGDGLINDGTELFGDATPAYEAGTTTPTTGKTADGFEALAQEDTNGDGVVNSADANFANLRVWQDANQDGISQAGELKTLSDLGIESFNVTSINHSQLLANGNQIADTGSYTRTDGSTGTAGVTAGMADVNLAVDTFHRTFTDVIPTTVDTATLPDMQGSGVVRDLREAASIQTAEGATLATALGQFSASTTRNEQRAQLDTLITDWAATSGFEDMATQAAAHGYTLTSNLSPEWQHKLTVLETFNGRGFYKMPWDTINAQSGVTGMSVSGNHITISMNGTQLALLDQAYSALKESVYDALLPQTRLKPYLDDIGLTLDASGSFSLDFAALDTRLGTAHTGNANTAIGDLLDLRRLMGDTLEGASWDGLALLTDWAATDAGDAAVAATLAEFGYNGGIHTAATGTVDGGNANDLVAGQGADDTLTGNIAANVLDGGLGADTLYAGTGDDTLIGGDGNDSLYGEAGNDLLQGNAGNDMLDGGIGADTMQGGLNDDTYIVDNLLDTTVEAAGEGIDTVKSDLIWTLADNLDNLILTGTAAIDGTGNTLDNVITGNIADNTLTALEGNDTLDGGKGADTMLGGVGDDTYIADNAGDIVTENLGEGTDNVQASVSYTLSDNVENLSLMASNMLQPGSANDDNYEDRRTA